MASTVDSGGALRGCSFARSSLIARDRRDARAMSAFINQSRAPGTPARAYDSTVTGR
jgi:hypothetical protein